MLKRVFQRDIMLNRRIKRYYLNRGTEHLVCVAYNFRKARRARHYSWIQKGTVAKLTNIILRVMPIVV